MELAGKVALVTGGSRGIGAAIAKRLARDGADIAVTYLGAAEKAHSVVAEIEAMGRRAIAIQADSADAAAVAGAVETTVAGLGRLDILVNNAGIFALGPPEAVTPEELDRALAIHAKAAFVASQAALKHMAAGASIVSIGSCLAERAGAPGLALYAMSKAALAGMTKGLAHDLGGRGITVNLVQPGSTDTDMNPADGALAEEQRRHTPLGRFARPEEIAATVAFLAGEDGRFITGASIAVDGGFAA